MEHSNAHLASHFIPRPPEPYGSGYTRVTAAGDADTGGLDTRIDFGIRIQLSGETIVESHSKESVWVLLRGEVKVSAGDQSALLTRGSIFDEAPSGIHVGPATELIIENLGGEAEWAVSRTDNDKQLKVRIFTPETLSPEYRGAGLVQDACRRNVRLIFDYDNNPESNLVIGEVVNYPGRWSSYPPHHHDQPEIYYYRFTEPQGYGHAELGDAVFKVQHNDTMIIPPQLDHAQVSAPGYGMWYLWVIRHLEGNPYTGFEFTEDHAWTLDPENQGWEPQED